jgi:glycerol-3-phosphate dehydrogenase subunit B
MVAGDLRSRDPMLIVGFDRFPDLNADWVADNLAAQGVLARSTQLQIGSLTGRREINAMLLGRLFETEDFRIEMADLVRERLGDADRIGFPAVLGVHNALQVVRDLEKRLGRKVFEIPILPPSLPGIRLHKILVDSIAAHGGNVFEGMEVVSAETDGGKVSAVWSEAAGRNRAHRAGDFVLATGGILGGGIRAELDGAVTEQVFGLPVAGVEKQSRWFARGFLAPEGHPIHRSGIQTDPDLRAVDDQGAPVYQNLRVVGGMLAHCDALRERSLEGIALATGHLAGRIIGSDLRI